MIVPRRGFQRASLPNFFPPSESQKLLDHLPVPSHQCSRGKRLLAVSDSGVRLLGYVYGLRWRWFDSIKDAMKCEF